MTLLRLFCRCLPALVPAWLAATVWTSVEFSHTEDVGFGQEVVVSGPGRELGEGDPLRAVKLVWTTGNVWRGVMALPAGATVSYRFGHRSYLNTDWSDPAKIVWLTEERTVTAPAHVAPPWPAKTILLHSTWPGASILYRDITHNGEWTSLPMADAGPGRNANERCYRVDGVAVPGAEIEFVFFHEGQWLNAPAPPNSPPYAGQPGPYNFRTTLDVIFVQDQQVFAARPPATVSAPRFETRQVGSQVPGIPGRTVTILLPRGYDSNPTKRYPVVLFHDGQNVFSPGGPFGSWDADIIARYETSQGRMREAIVVAVPNGNELGSDRLQEYLPNGDTLSVSGAVHNGRAASYRAYLLDHVLPALDANYRTLGDAAHTMVVGSSMGGLVSDYLGATRPDRFGVVGIFSPAYWTAPNFEAARDGSVPGPRRFLSMGTAESGGSEAGSNPYWQGALTAYNTWLAGGAVVGGNLKFVGTAGARHNEEDWARVLPEFYTWALDPWTEPQELAAELFPARLGIEVAGADAVRLRIPVVRGVARTLWESTDLKSWTEVGRHEGTVAWDEVVIEPAGGGVSRFWRLSLP